jgi:acetyl-CoA carboxylase biotin carboxyl carrier protein
MDDIRKLIEILEESDLAEIEVTRWWGWGRVRVAKSSPNHALGATSHGNGSGGCEAEKPLSGKVEPSAVAAAAPPPAPAPEKGYVEIRSPMVGTFYRTPAPDADPYVEVGHQVEVGQTVCIIEAMKLMNEIESDVKGRIVSVKVEHKHPVEYGQVLFLVEPS